MEPKVRNGENDGIRTKMVLGLKKENYGDEKIQQKSKELKKKNVKSYMNLYNSMYDCVHKAYSKNEKADPWSDPKVRRAANEYLKNSPNDPDGVYPEVYKNKKAADRKMIKGIAAGAALGGITIGALGLAGGIPMASIGTAIGIGGSFCGALGSTVVERMESVQRANRDYKQALQDTITHMYETVDLDY